MFKLLRIATSASVLGLAAVVMAPSASAAMVTGSWDPPMVSPPFDGMGWATTINFSVPDECLGSSGIINVRFLNRSFNCATSTPAIRVLRAQVGLYDLTTEIFKYAITLDASSLRPNILDITVDGKVTYLFSLLPSASEMQTIEAEDLNIPNVPDIDRNYWFRLAMPGGAPVLEYSTSRFTGFNPASAPDTSAFLTSFRVDEFNPLTDVNARQAVLDATEIKVGNSLNAVPEPQTLALALLALIAAGAASGRGRHHDKTSV